jgi:two-component system KDP operon response regulator KdpE
MTPRARLLIVDDEPQIRRVLRVTLEAEGFEVREVSDAEAPLDVAASWRPDLVITDLSMPDITGLELIRHIRAASPIPIVVLSEKGDDTIAALDAGADDYVTKPFSMNALMACIRVALKRARPRHGDEPPAVALGDFVIDRARHVVSAGGRRAQLSPHEFDLFVYFARHPGKVLTPATLLDGVWGGEHRGRRQYLRVFVGQLRKKIEADPARPKYLRTESFAGYRLDVS